MKSELETVITTLREVLDGEPWYGQPVNGLLRSIDAGYASVKPNEDSHSLVELIYHMLTWTEFTIKRIQGDKVNDLAAFEKLDWREIDPKVHGWEEGLSAFIAANQELIALLGTKDDSFLDQKVDYRKYNFRTLLQGLIHHHIYHAGQVAYLKKLLG